MRRGLRAQIYAAEVLAFRELDQLARGPARTMDADVPGHLRVSPRRSSTSSGRATSCGQTWASPRAGRSSHTRASVSSRESSRPSSGSVDIRASATSACWRTTGWRSNGSRGPPPMPSRSRSTAKSRARLSPAEQVKADRESEPPPPSPIETPQGGFALATTIPKGRAGHNGHRLPSRRSARITTAYAKFVRTRHHNFPGNPELCGIARALLPFG